LPNTLRLVQAVEPTDISETKTCPFCAERIQTAALKCKHCASMLPVVAIVAPSPVKLGWFARYWRWAMGRRHAAIYGPVNQRMQCPHCQVPGCVRLKAVRRKKGISGAKAIGALMTGGLSLVATGIARKDNLTQARCDHCTVQWDF
jgi:hypothetical protein